MWRDYRCTSRSSVYALCEKEITCINLLPPSNGKVYTESEHFIKGKTLIGHKAIITCNEGFILKGSATLTCIGDGPENRFDGQQPACELLEVWKKQMESVGKIPFYYIGFSTMSVMLGASLFISIVFAVLFLYRQHKWCFARKRTTAQDEEDEHAYADITEYMTPLEERLHTYILGQNSKEKHAQASTFLLQWECSQTFDGIGSRVNIQMAEHNTQGPVRNEVPKPDQENTDGYLAPCDSLWNKRQKRRCETKESLPKSSKSTNLEMAPGNGKSKLQTAKCTVNNGASTATTKDSQDGEPKYLEVIASPEDIGQMNAGNNMKQPQPRDAAMAASRLSTDESYDYVGMPRFILPPQMKKKNDKSKKNESYVDMESLGATSSHQTEENTSRNGKNEDVAFSDDDYLDEYDDVIGTSTENQYMALSSEEQNAAESGTEKTYASKQEKEI